MHGLMSYRCFGRARSLRSDRAEQTLGRYVATEQDKRSVATIRTKLYLGNIRCDVFLTEHDLLRKDILVLCGDLDVSFVVTVFDAIDETGDVAFQSCFGDVAGRLQETGEIKNTLDATAKGNPYIHSCLWFFHSMIRENTDYVSKYGSPAAFHPPSRQAYTLKELENGMTKDVLLDLIKSGYKSDMKSRKQAGARRANRKRSSVLVCPRSSPPLDLNLRRPSIWALMEFL
ncbi:hypothetical protein F2Q69_00031037 [Brassica cretica]|uniref:Uncharacterized protein n=1 Tax=Brassica cretica TaxID=69181 RepID=A0A8S9S0J1_BRACR|nr:hypothetical protein F2Q69_00031037 [Brassica cretica]